MALKAGKFKVKEPTSAAPSHGEDKKEQVLETSGPHFLKLNFYVLVCVWGGVRTRVRARAYVSLLD